MGHETRTGVIDRKGAPPRHTTVASIHDRSEQPERHSAYYVNNRASNGIGSNSQSE